MSISLLTRHIHLSSVVSGMDSHFLDIDEWL